MSALALVAPVELSRSLQACEPLRMNPAAVYLARLATNSRETMGRCLRNIAALAGHTPDSMPWGTLRYQDTQVFRTIVAERYSFRTANLHLAALRSVLREAWKLGAMSAEEMHRASELEPVRGHREPAGRHVARTELHDLFAVLRATMVGRRDAALLALLAGCGLRRAEVAALDLGAYDRAHGSLRVLGKGNKERVVYVTNGARDALHAWLEARGELPGPLLCPVRKGGRVQLRHMTPQAVLCRLRYLARLAGVDRFSPHDLRRTFCSDLLDAGADLVAVQALMGHASPSTTARYDRRGERARMRAAALMNVPYNRKAHAD